VGTIVGGLTVAVTGIRIPMITGVAAVMSFDGVALRAEWPYGPCAGLWTAERACREFPEEGVGYRALSPSGFRALRRRRSHRIEA